MAFEMFCGMLGRLFEPYVKQVIPHLLFCFGDGNQFVREVREEHLPLTAVTNIRHVNVT